MLKRRENLVKNTTDRVLDGLVSMFSSPLCRGCGDPGEYLCLCCKKYILRGFFARKVIYLDDPTCLEEKKIAQEMKKIFTRVDFLGFRDELLGEMIEEYKYKSVRGMARVLGELVFELYFKKDKERVVLVPMPTSWKHIRERGFDHIHLIAKEIEKRSLGRIEVLPLLVRVKNTVQVGMSNEVRNRQAKEAVRVNERLLMDIDDDLEKTKVVLFDDVWTTGASMREAGKKLRDAGIGELDGLVMVKTRPGISPVIRSGRFMDLNDDV